MIATINTKLDDAADEMADHLQALQESTTLTPSKLVSTLKPLYARRHFYEILIKKTIRFFLESPMKIHPQNLCNSQDLKL